MKENLIKTLQKFLNSPFKYAELLVILDKQKTLLLQENVILKTEECEYNALWDTVLEIEKNFAIFNKPNLVINTEFSVTILYDHNFKSRQKYVTNQLNKSQWEKFLSLVQKVRWSLNRFITIWKKKN
jgi:hypothetical protein